MTLTKKKVESLVQRLKQLSFESASEMLWDAWQNATEEPAKQSRTMTVFGLVRELDRVLREYAASIARLTLDTETVKAIEESIPPKDNRPDLLTTSNALIGSAFGYSLSKEEALEVYDGGVSFHKLAHPPATTQRKWDTDKILAVMDRWIDYVLIRALDAIETKISKVLKIIAIIASNKPDALPKAERKLFDYIKQNPVLLDNLLSKVQDFSWIRFLKAEGVFDNPPSKTQLANGNFRFAYWPIPMFLKRVAKFHNLKDADYQLIVDVINEIDSEHGNPNIFNNLLDVGAHLPASYAKQLVPNFSIWAPAMVTYHIAFDVSKFINHLIQGGEPQAGVEAFYIYLEQGFLRDPALLNDGDIHHSQMREFLKDSLASVVDAEGVTVLQYFLKQTNNAIAVASGANEGEEHSLAVEKWRTYFWVEGGALGGARYERDAIASLIHTVVSCAERLIHNGVSLADVLSQFEPYPWLTMVRIKYHLLSRHAQTPEQLQQKQQLNRVIGRDERKEDSFSAGIIVHRSPKSIDELTAMSWSEIASYLNSEEVSGLPDTEWNPNRTKKPDSRGLKDVLKQIVLKNPKELLANRETLKSIPFTYAMTLLDALQQSELDNVYECFKPLYAWIQADLVHKLSEENKVKVDNFVLMSLDNKFFSSHKSPISLSEPLPKLLEKLLTHPQVNLDKEIEKFEDNPAGISTSFFYQNSSSALNSYLRVYFFYGSTYEEVSKRSDLKELQTILEPLLDVESLNYVYVIGHFIPHLIRVLPEWTINVAMQKLLETSSLEKRQVAAFAILSAKVVLKALDGRYLEWLELYKTQPESKKMEWLIPEHLIGHLMYLHFEQMKPVQDKSSWGYRLFDESSLDFKRAVLEHLRYYIDTPSGGAAKNELIKELFSWRIEVGEPDEGRAIYDWLSQALKWDQKWTFEQLSKVLRNTRHIETNETHSRFDMLIHYLAEIEVVDFEGLMNVLEEWVYHDMRGYLHKPDVVKLVSVLSNQQEFSERIENFLQRISVRTGDLSYLDALSE